MPHDPDAFPDGARVGADPAAADARPREPTASAGFGSPGSDFTVKRIDLNEALIRHPQATFVMRASGDAMAEAGIWSGDVLLVDRAVAAAHGHLVAVSWRPRTAASWTRRASSGRLVVGQVRRIANGS